MERATDTRALPGEPNLVRRSKSGDTDAFGLLVSHYQDSVFNVVFRMLGNYENARDVTQDVFVKAFRQIRSFEGRSSFHTWLYAIAVNQTISAERHSSAGARAGEVQLSAIGGQDDAAYDPPGREPAPDERMDADESHRCIQLAIAGLDNDYRAVLVLRDIEGLDYDSIGRVLGAPRGTVKSRLHRARAQLKQKFQKLLNK